jgi:hypothetical protein
VFIFPLPICNIKIFSFTRHAHKVKKRALKMSNQWLTALLLLSSMLESTASVGSELVSPSSASGFTSRFDLEGGVTNGREAALLTF